MLDLIRTKTFWLGIVSIAGGIGLCIAGQYPKGIEAIGSGLFAIFLRDGLRKMQDPKASAEAAAMKEDLKLKKAQAAIGVKQANVDARKKALAGKK